MTFEYVRTFIVSLDPAYLPAPHLITHISFSSVCPATLLAHTQHITHNFYLIFVFAQFVRGDFSL